jgi:beta-phosphoglucomutase-like phosphatase (HAD superfamily)
VVEDAPAGIEAAHRGGMRAIGVLTTHPTLQADIVAPKLADLLIDASDGLLP